MIKVRKIKVLHAPSDPGGQVGFLTRKLKGIGVDARSLIIFFNKFGFQHDYYLNLERVPNRFLRMLTRMLIFPFFLNYDIYHFHTTSSLIDMNLDARILRALKKKVIFHFHGTDVRRLYEAGVADPLHYANYTHIDPKAERPKKYKLDRIRKYADILFVSDYELLQYVEDAVMVPRIIDEELIRRERLSEPKPTNLGQIVIAHIPSNPDKKGSLNIKNIMEEFVANRSNVVFRYLVDLSHTEALSEIKKADLFIEQTDSGIYGVQALEALGLGIPVITNPSEEELNHFDFFPMIPADRNGIVLAIERFLQDPDKFKQSAFNEGWKFIETYHDAKKTAELVAGYYERLLGRS